MTVGLRRKRRAPETRERKTNKIINTSVTVTVHIAMVHKCTILHSLMWVFFCSNCVKLTIFFILHNYT